MQPYKSSQPWSSSRRAFLGSIKTALYRRPKDELMRLRRWGPRAYLRCGAWAAEMELAATQLPPLPAGSPDAGRALEVWYLTGDRFWYQTAFCAWSLAFHCQRKLVLHMVDDGTLTIEQEQQLRRLFPHGMTRWKQDVASELDRHLPVARFPVLRQRWGDYINIRKLTDIHLGSIGTKLVLDSDMLFFSRPDELLTWWENPTQPCLMTDCEESYGFSRQLMEELAGAPIPPLLNVGICGLASEWIDWEELEHWCRTLVEREGTSYYLEQALVAMLAARRQPVVMPASDYITFPTRQQALAGDGVLQHYVADSKPWYLGEAWKLILHSPIISPHDPQEYPPRRRPT